MTVEEQENSSFFAHLEALRRMLIHSVAALGVLLIPGFFAAGWLMPVLLQYLSGEGEGAIKFHYFSPLEPFLMQLKLGILLALFAALPYISMQISRFVAPALYARERKIVHLAAGAVFVLFLAGSAFAFFLVLPVLLEFSRSYSSNELTPMLGLANFVELAGLLLLGFGIVFQLPVLLLVLIRCGMVRVETLRKQRPVIVVAILVVAAVLTPPDVISQLLMATPAYLLFEISLLIGARIEPPHEPEEPAAPEPPNKDAIEADDSFALYAKAQRPKRRRIRPIK